MITKVRKSLNFPISQCSFSNTQNAPKVFDSTFEAFIDLLDLKMLTHFRAMEFSFYKTNAKQNTRQWQEIQDQL